MMLQRGRVLLDPYWPAITILAGAILVAFGGFWAAWRQEDFNARLNEKNNQIIALQDQQINSITGGDTYPILTPSFKGDGKLTMDLRTIGKFTLYELQITILDQDLFSLLKEQNVDVATVNNQSRHVIKMGNFGPNQGTEIASFNLDEKAGSRNFLIFFIARNGPINEMMRLRWVKGRWSVAFKVYNDKGTLKEQVGPEYPSDQLWN